MQFAIKPVPCTPPIVPSLIASKAFDNRNDNVTNQNNEDVSVSITDEKVELVSTNRFVHLCIFSIDGKLMRQSQNATIPTNELPSGVYIIKAITETGNIYQNKFLKQ